jgi:hypothetical protein
MQRHVTDSPRAGMIVVFVNHRVPGAARMQRHVTDGPAVRSERDLRQPPRARAQELQPPHGRPAPDRVIVVFVNHRTAGLRRIG